MADGKTHLLIGGITGIICSGISTYLYLSNTISQESLLYFNGGLLLGNYATPDVDQEMAIHPMFVIADACTRWIPDRKLAKRIHRALLKIQESFFAFYSIPAAHRHYLTHFPGISTIIRFAYIYILISFFRYGPNFPLIWNNIVELVTVNSLQIVALLIGMCIIDITHAFLDKWNFHW